MSIRVVLSAGKNAAPRIATLALLLELACRASASSYTVVDLATAGYDSTVSTGAGAGVQVGYGFNVDENNGNDFHALLWNSSPTGVIDLNPTGFDFSVANATTDTNQVGYGQVASTNAIHALLWTSTAASAVDLNPTNYSTSQATGISGTQEVGYGLNSSSNYQALLWTGSSSAAIDLNPATFSSSKAFATNGTKQVGFGISASTGNSQALLWSGTASNVINLNPSGYTASIATAISGTQEVGYGSGTSTSNNDHALLWNSTASSVVDLNPTGFTESQALATIGTIQVGYGDGTATDGDEHALLWNSTAASVVDLQAFLPSTFQSSIATGIDANGDIVGYAYDDNFVAHAILWQLVTPTSTLTWTGAADSTTWDAATLAGGGTLNWLNTATSSASVFHQGDIVTFPDITATAATINLTISLLPTSIAITSNTTNYTFTGSGAIRGSASITKTGNSTLTIATANTFSGGITLNAGQLNINNSSAIGTGPLTLSGGNLDNTSGAAITLTTNNAQSWNANFTFLGSSSLNLGTGAVAMNIATTLTVNANTLTVGGPISGPGLTLTKSGAGILVLSGNNTYGNTTINTGTLQIGNNTAGGTLGTGPVSDFSTLAFKRTDTAEFSNLIAGSGALQQIGSGTIILSAANTYIGATTINPGGTIQIGDGTNTTAQLGNAISTTATGPIIDNGSLTVLLSGNPSSAWLNNLSGNGSLSLLSGSAVSIKFDGNNSGFTGNATLQSGTRLQWDNTTSPFASSSTITVQSGAGLFFTVGTGASSYGGNLFLAGTGYTGDNPALGAIRFGGGPETLTGNIALTADTQLAGSTATIAGPITGNFNLLLGATATLATNITLSNSSNSYTGNTTINATTKTGGNTIKLGIDNALPNGPAAGNLLINGNTTNLSIFDLNGHNQILNGLSAGGIVAGAEITNSAATTISTLTVGSNDQTSTYSGLLLDGAGQLALTKTGAGILTLSGNNTYSGPTIINSGTLQFTSPTSTIANIIGPGALSISGNLTLRQNSPLSNIAALTLTGTLDITNNKLIIEDTSPTRSADITALKNQIGTNLLSSTATAANAAAGKTVMVVAVSDNAVRLASFPSGSTNFGGTNNVDQNSILITTAFLGDANLDGVVDIQDLTVVANHWQQPAIDWSQGDFDGNGVVDIQDLTAVANNWQAGVGSGSSESFSQALALIPASPPSTVPEPASLALLTPGAAVILGRRRKNRPPC